MKSIIPLLAASLLIAPLASAGQPDKSDTWQALSFNGTFAGWQQPVGGWFVTDTATLDAGKTRFRQHHPATGDIAINGPAGKEHDLISKAEFGDCEIHVEFMLAQHSNSGVYVMGSYEVQIYDSFGVAKDRYPGIECGGIYPQWIHNSNQSGHSPLVNAAQPCGEWQSFDIVFQAPRFAADGKKSANAKLVKVIHNGKTVHENVELTGPTRGGCQAEKAAGPLRLQGDHGPVAYRNVRIRPVTQPSSTRPR